MEARLVARCKAEIAVWRTDGSEKPNAKVWRELVCKLWRSQVSRQTDASGIFSARGHRGLYEITIETAGEKTVMPFSRVGRRG
jgi:hypothetical protein